jgi:hypothetical protein
LTRRRAIRLSLVALLCLLLGAGTTVGVAWWLRNSALPSRPLERRMALGPKVWPWTVTSSWPQVERALSVRGWGYRGEEGWSHKAGGIVPFEEWRVGVHRTGWPWVALTSVRWFHSGVGFEAGLEGAVEVDVGLRSLELAYTPSWPGLLGDLGVFGAAWWLLLSTPMLTRTVRRRFRISRGVCAACGYDLKGSPLGTCPECGNGAGAKS